jgi:hypothetical protein
MEELVSILLTMAHHFSYKTVSVYTHQEFLLGFEVVRFLFQLKLGTSALFKQEIIIANAYVSKSVLRV